MRAVFLDRDGVLNKLCTDARTGLAESPLSVDDVELTPAATTGVRRLRQAGFLLIGVTNQPSAAKGTITVEEQTAIHQRVLDLLALDDATLDDWRICPHHPHGTVTELAKVCDCRKPSPGMLLDAARAHGIDLGESWTVGDSDSDIAAGKGAGTRTVLVGLVNGHKRQRPDEADFATVTFDEAIDHILKST